MPARIGLETIAQQLLRSESTASSQIAGISVPSNRSLAKTLAGGRHADSARAALANIEAVKWAYQWARDTREPFSVEMIKQIHCRIAKADKWLIRYAGQLRTEQNWIAICARFSTASTCRRPCKPGSLMSSSRPFTRFPTATEGWDARSSEPFNRLEESGVMQKVSVAKNKRAWESVGLFRLVDEMEHELSRGAHAPADSH